MPRIRDEEPGDAAGIDVLVEKAFARALEVDLVRELRRNGRTVLSLVAEEQGRLLGHVLFTPVLIERESDALPALGLAPLSVLPAFQRLGIGSALVSAGLQRLRELGHSRVVVLGEPAYYSRFGFLPASSFGVRFPTDVPEEAFMALALEPGSLDHSAGVTRYSPEFDNL